MDSATTAARPSIFRSDLRDLRRGVPFIAPWLIGLAVFTLLPVGLALYYSFCDYQILTPPVYRGLQNYRDLLADGVFWTSLRQTGYYAALAIPGGLMVSLGLALLLNCNIRGQGIYRTIIFLPTLVPTVASAVLWMWLLNGKLGLINYLLRWVGITGPDWLGGKGDWAIPALALMSLWGVGHAVVIYLAGLQDVPRELYEAADIDGATGWRRLWHVTLPMISPVIFFNLIIALIGTLQYFANAQIMTNGGPDRKTLFYVLYLYNNAFTYLNMGYASAMAWVLLIIIMALTALAFWTSRRWVYYQGK